MVGQTLLRYQITEQIGAGGMGVVYKAIDTQLRRTVAIKLLPQDQGGNPTAHERFLREARAASALTHPNIVTVYEINSDRGISFLAMEYIDGETLDKRLRQGALNSQEVLGYAAQFAEGLAKAHATGIVHRDLKPGNLMITADGTLKILDFGLARMEAGEHAVAADAVTHRALTLPGTAMGTPGYMSPEQSLGDSADARSDVFSFGVILYRMVTGTMPFDGVTVPQLLRAVVVDPPRPITRLPEGLPEELRDIILRCLEKEKERRFASAVELLPLLRELRTRALVSASLAPAVSRTELSKRPAPTKLAWLVVPATVLVAAGGWFGLESWRELGHRGQGAAAALRGSPRELVGQAREKLVHYYRPGNLDEAGKLLEAAVTRDGRFAPAYAALAELHSRRYNNTRDPQWMKLAGQYARRAVELNPDLAVGHIAVGRVLADQGQREAATKALRQALDLDPRNADAHLALARVHAAARDDAAADASFRSGLEADPNHWLLLVEAGLAAFRKSRYKEALELTERAAKLTPDNDVVFRNLSAILIFLGRPEDAAAAVQRALEIRPEAPHWANLGYIRFFQGRYLDAIGPFERAVEKAPSKYIYWGNLGDAYRWTPGNQQKAAESYTRALQLVRDGLVATPEDAEMRGSEAAYLAKLGRKQEALARAGELAKEAKATPGARFKGALAAEIAGNRELALEQMGRALAAGYSVREVQNEPEFTELRRDVRYHRLISKYIEAQEGK